MKDYICNNEANILKTWQYLHTIPELAFEEFATSKWLADKLFEAGFDVKTEVAGTGVIAKYDTGIDGPQIGLRADMDALQFNVNGEVKASHACGHDANCTEILWAAIAVKKSQLLKSGCLTVVFQPAEESLRGADGIIDSGELAGLDYLIGVHLRPKEELPLGKISPAVLHGASGSMEIIVHGENAHGARPQQGINAIEAAALIISAVHSLHFDPTVPHSVKPTKIASGNTPFNVIPDNVTIIFDMRAQTNELMSLLQVKVSDTAVRAGEAIGAHVECRWRGGVPAAQRFDNLIDIAARSITESIGNEGLADTIYTSGGEDFHKYAIAYPNLQSTVIGVGADLVPGLHKIDMRFDTSAIISAVSVLTTLVLNIQNEYKSK